MDEAFSLGSFECILGKRLRLGTYYSSEMYRLISRGSLACCVLVLRALVLCYLFSMR